MLLHVCVVKHGKTRASLETSLESGKRHLASHKACIIYVARQTKSITNQITFNTHLKTTLTNDLYFGSFFEHISVSLFRREKENVWNNYYVQPNHINNTITDFDWSCAHLFLTCLEHCLESCCQILQLFAI